MYRTPNHPNHPSERRRRGLDRARTVTALVAGGSVVGVAALVDITAKSASSHQASIRPLAKATSSSTTPTTSAATTAPTTASPTTTTPTTEYVAPQPVVSQPAPVQSGSS